MKKFLVILFLFLFAIPTFAYDWVLIEPLGFYIRKTSIIKDKEFVKAEIVYAEADGYDKYGNKKYISKRFIEADCRRNQFWYLRGKKYKRNKFTTSDYVPINPEKLKKLTLNTYEQRQIFVDVLCSIK